MLTHAMDIHYAISAKKRLKSTWCVELLMEFGADPTYNLTDPSGNLSIASYALLTVSAVCVSNASVKEMKIY